MATICPTITATNIEEYNSQLAKIAVFSGRLHIDLMDGEFTETKSPPLSEIWWPKHLRADIHLMYQKPMDFLAELKRLHPALVIIHAEADINLMHFAAELHRDDIRAGLAILQDTTVENIEESIHSFDHLLIFSGHLGYHGGEADLRLLSKIKAIRAIDPDIEISWDGGINGSNIKSLVEGGVSVLNVGGYIQHADNPAANYQKLIDLVGK